MRWPVPSNFTGVPNNNGGCPSEPAVHECLATWTCNAYREKCPEERLGRQRLPIALGKGRFLDPDADLRIAAKVNYGLATAFIMIRDLERSGECG
jgi:hypothetical protein